MGRNARIIAVFDNIQQERLDAGMAPQRVRMIRNAIDLSRAVTYARSVAEVRAELGIGEHTQFLLLFGWAPQIKGVDTAIEAAKPGRRRAAGNVGTGGKRGVARVCASQSER